MPEGQRRRRSPRPFRRRRRDCAAPPPPDVSPDVHSRSSRFGVLQRLMNIIASAARLSALWRNVGRKNSTDSPSKRSTHLSSLLNRSDSPPDNTGMFYNAHDCTVTGTFVDASNVTYNNNTASNHFMKELWGETIPGAEHDSSDRDPPPRCQPGTRLAILERCLYFISNCNGVQKMRWVVGAAGVGKSALMQSVAESPDLPGGPPVSVFFSVNGRNDGSKAIATLSYQLAARSDSYRQIIEHEITRDPSLLRSSMAKQFNKLIAEPFIHNSGLNSAGRVLVIIDGLDECKDHRTQLELLRLISDLCLTHPSSPLVWLIASRPEPHITSFFSRRDIIAAYEKEEVPIDSNEARADVERFLREELTKIKDGSDSLDPRWPEERDFWKVTNAAGGLFAYAQTVINYIGDSRVGSPASQLSDVLRVIDKYGMTGLSREEHPMALLDALYERILSNVPGKIMINTRKLLLALALSNDSTGFCLDIDMSFLVLCNWLGLTADEAYAAVHHLRSVLYVPRRDKAHKEKLRAFHKSFMDYISDFTRSGLSSDFLADARRSKTECTSRILTGVPNGIQSDCSNYKFICGDLAVGLATYDKIPLAWLVEELGDRGGDKIRLDIYALAVDDVLRGISLGKPTFRSEFYIRFLATVWSSYNYNFPHYEVLKAVFDETRRPEFMMHGLLKQIPLKAIAVSGLDPQLEINLQVRAPSTTMEKLSIPRSSSCWHEWEAEQAGGWDTTFQAKSLRSIPTGLDCAFCFKRLKHQLETWKTNFPDDTALVMFTSTGACCVQVRLVDPEYGRAEWTYSFWCEIPQDVRRTCGSTV